MAVITFGVQSLLNSADTVSITINDTSTISALKIAINTSNGVDPNIIRLGFGGAVLLDASTIASYGITNGSYVRGSNSIADLPTKQAKQAAKLALAGLRRAAAGDITAPFYRARHTLNITSLPTNYVGDVVVANPGPLVDGRPWI